MQSGAQKSFRLRPCYPSVGNDTDGGRRDDYTLTVHSAAPERIYTAAGGGYALSTDRGETWADAYDQVPRGLAVV